MKPTGFIKDKSISKQLEERPFERGDWVKSSRLGFGIQTVGIVNEDMKVTWLDGWVSESYVNTAKMNHVRHLTAEELAMFNLKCD
jgi:hypothetical protein